MIDNIFKISQNENIDDEVSQLFNYWRNQGFPNYSSNDYDVKKELEKLIKFNENSIYNNKYLNQTMHCCGFLWTFFPHWVDVKYDDNNTLMDNWNDDKKLKTLIRKTYRWQQKHGNGTFTTNRLRQNAKVYLNKQTVSNFRPTVAKYIYNTYGNNGTVWDMCSGWGGRLMGFLASNAKHYIGTDPSTKTYEGLIKLKNTYNYINKDVDIYLLGSEDFIPDENSIDLCFTSPPYFNTEKYSDEDTQSWKKFQTKDSWLNGYLKTTIQNCKKGLKRDGFLIINIANVKSFPNLEDETIRIVTQEGFILVDTLYLILSSIAGKGIKTEPIFIFKLNNNF